MSKVSSWRYRWPKRSHHRYHNQRRGVRNFKTEDTTMLTVKEYLMLPDSKRTQFRCGILPYLFHSGKLYMCFGQDRATGDYTDFGGGRCVTETTIDAALREGSEELCCSLGKINPEDILNSICLYNKHMFIILIDVQSLFPNLDSVTILSLTTSNFDTKAFVPGHLVDKRQYLEIERIVWLSEEVLEDVFINNGFGVKIYTRVRKFIKSCTSLTKSLSVMKEVLMAHVKVPLLLTA